MLHNKGTDLYNNNGCDYKAIPYDGLHIQSNTPPASSEVTLFKINKRHSFLINFVTLFIHQVYNNKDLLATTVMMIKTLALFFSNTSTVLFS